MADSRHILVVVEDAHAERHLRRALDRVRARAAGATVLTADALLALRLRREGIDARLTVDGLTRDKLIERDALALAGVASAFGATPPTGVRAHLEYTLIPAFVRAVRNVTAVGDFLFGRGPGPIGPGGEAGPGGQQIVMLVGGGPLVAAARLVARHRGVPIEQVGDLLQRLGQVFSRLVAGRATRWVNSQFRALVLEPGFIDLLLFKGFWRRIVEPPPPPGPRALIVVGDRFTADVVECLHEQTRQVVLAGATQPGRALFDNRSGLVPIEAFTDWLDPLRNLVATFEAIVDAASLATDRAAGQRFTVNGMSYWPLVRSTVCLHLVAWMPMLKQVRALAERVARTHPDAQLLTSTDVTAYNRVLVETVRRFGIRSVGIQHGIPGEPNGHSIVRVDTFAAWGVATEQWYRALAPQTTRFAVTGNPRFDALARRAPRTPNPARIPFTITVCTGFMGDFSVGATELENLLMMEAVLQWAKTREGVRVIHKMHPGEELDYYAAAARALGWDPLMLTTIREPILYDVLEKSDVLVAAYSTTVLESVALGTPAIVFDAIVQRKLLPLDRIPGVTIAFSLGELHQQLDACRVAPPPDRQMLRSSAELRAYLFDLDGRATERVAALMT